MVQVRPFAGLRFDPRRVGDLGRVVCPPYDVISRALQVDLYARSPFNLVRLELGRDEPGDDERRNRYTRAEVTLAEWRAAGVVVSEPAPTVYLHEACFSVGERRFVRRDLLAAVELAPWEAGQVLPHERTMQGPKEDRL